MSEAGADRKQAEQQLAGLAKLLALQTDARQAESPKRLVFHMVNQTRQLLTYRQGIFLSTAGTSRARLEAVSNVAVLDKDAPFVRWITRACRAVLKTDAATSIHEMTATALPPKLQEGWSEWLPLHVLWCPLLDHRGRLIGVLLFGRDTGWQDSETVLAQRAVEAYSHAYAALSGRSSGWTRKLSFSRVLKLGIAAALVGVLLMPVRLSVLAPAEIIPKDPVIVAAPLDGVVETIHVEPNSQVSEGTLIVSFEASNPASQVEIAQRNLAAAEAELLTATQGAFANPRGSGRLAELEAMVGLRQAELALAEDVLSRVKIFAERDGIAVYAGASDWLGRPVRTGERIMTLATQDQVQLDIQMPVDDSMILPANAEVDLFLNIDPLSPLTATVVHASHEAQMTPSQVLAFQVTAYLDPNAPIPRIGARGTAKIKGEEVTLAYFLFRRPLAFLRQTFGL